MAEAVFQHIVDEAALTDEIHVDSAGTGSWHVGEPAHSGTRRVLAQHGINYVGYARQVSSNDLNRENTYIIAMDMSNIRDLQSRFGYHPRMHKILDFANEVDIDDVPDPYYNGNFEEVYLLVEDGCRGLLAMIREEENL
jgi:protein-tyrosine phosphatase